MTNDLFEERKEPPCHEKIPFPTQEEAQAAAIMARHQYGVKLKTYLCRDCGSWHLSSA